MSSSNRPFAVRIGVLFSMAILLSGCGFRPLHGQYSAGENPGASATLSTVYVEPIPDRSGQMMRTALERRLSPNGQSSAQQYRLSVTLSESISKLAVEQNAFATRANLTLTASYSLVRVQDGFQYPSSYSTAVSSYNILSSNYATRAAELNARERAIETLASDLRTRIAITLSAPTPPSTSGNRLP